MCIRDRPMGARFTGQSLADINQRQLSPLYGHVADLSIEIALFILCALECVINYPVPKSQQINAIKTPC